MGCNERRRRGSSCGPQHLSLLVLVCLWAALLLSSSVPSLALPEEVGLDEASSSPHATAAVPTRDDDLCQSLRPTLWIHKRLLPGPQLDTRDRSVTVVVEWQMEVVWPEGAAWDECRYVVRVTDGVPALPLRVPNELAHQFATTHNSSFVHREYAVSPSRSASSVVKHDSWNYTLHIQPVSLSPLNDVLQVVLPSPRLTLFSAAADGSSLADSVIGEATLASPAVLTLSLYYAPSSVSLHDALALSLVCVVLIVVCHFAVASRLNKAVKIREEGVKGRTEAAVVATTTKQPLAPPAVGGSDSLTNTPARAAVEDVPSSTQTTTLEASPSDGSTSSSSTVPFRFKARDTRKRFTRPQPSGGSLDY